MSVGVRGNKKEMPTTSLELNAKSIILRGKSSLHILAHMYLAGDQQHIWVASEIWNNGVRELLGIKPRIRKTEILLSVKTMSKNGQAQNILILMIWKENLWWSGVGE